MSTPADIEGVPAGPNQSLVDVHQAAIAAIAKLAEHQANGRQSRVFAAVLSFTALWCRFLDRVALARLADAAGIAGDRRDAERHAGDALRWLDERKIVFYVPGRGRRSSLVGIWPIAAESDPLTTRQPQPHSESIAARNDPLISGQIRRTMRPDPAHNVARNDPLSKVFPRNTKEEGRSAPGPDRAGAARPEPTEGYVIRPEDLP